MEGLGGLEMHNRLQGNGKGQVRWLEEEEEEAGLRGRGSSCLVNNACGLICWFKNTPLYR